jgi:hypothetical protein
LRYSSALAEKYFGFTEFADDLFGGVSFSWHLTLIPFLILPNSTGSVFGGQVRRAGLIALLRRIKGYAKSCSIKDTMTVTCFTMKINQLVGVRLECKRDWKNS